MDRISSLPNEMICHIISFLSAKEAAYASVLSKRWRNLFTIIKNLEFDDADDNIEESLSDLLALPASSRVRNFYLRCRKRFDPTHYAQVNRFLNCVLKRGVLELTLDTEIVGKGYSFPFEVFTCETVVELILRTSLVIDVLPKNAFLPALKSLFLDSVRFCDRCGCCAFQKLLSACPI